jgi:hypothetical protein
MDSAKDRAGTLSFCQKIGDLSNEIERVYLDCMARAEEACWMR